jgi:hypothetical protein
VLGGLPVERVIAKGESQSAQRLFIYFNAIHHLDPVFDGAMITHNNNSIRADIPTPPIIKAYSENEIRNAPAIQPDTPTLRTWTVAGSTHSEYYTMIARAPILLRDLGLQAFDTCATPARSRVPFYMVDPHRSRAPECTAAAVFGNAAGAGSRRERQCAWRHSSSGHGGAGGMERGRDLRARRQPRDVR